MSDLAIVTDSTADVPEDLLRKYDVTTIPLSVTIAGRTYRDRVDLSLDRFYQLLAEAGVSSTSGPSPGVFAEVYRRLVQAGKKVLAIHLSGVLSGTFRTACLARQQLIDEGTAQAGDIVVVDSLNASMGLGWQVVAAAEAAARGLSPAEVLRLAERVRERVRLFVHVPTLVYLHRGGRIGSVSAMVGSLLNIIPLITLRDGGVVAAAKLRGEAQVLRQYLEVVGEAWTAAEKAGARFYLAVMHAHALEEAKALGDRLVAQLGLREQPLLVETGPVVGGHVGPGALGVAFYW